MKTSAVAPESSASATRSATKARSLDQYSCSQRIASGASAASSAGRSEDRVDWQKTVPAAPAARAVAPSPPGCMSRW